MPQACCKLLILSNCCNLSTSCNKLVNFIKLQQVCSNQPYGNLSFVDLLQLVETTFNNPVDNKFGLAHFWLCTLTCFHTDMYIKGSLTNLVFNVNCENFLIVTLLLFI